MFEAIVLAIAVPTAAMACGFARPSGAFKKSGLMLIGALVAPLALGFAVSPFIHDAAGMGLFFIVVALTVLIAGAALCVAVGAAARLGWNALK
jgi:hypothetical protein